MGKIYVCDICKEQFAEPYKIKKMKIDGHPELEICSTCANELVRHVNARVIEFNSLESYSKEDHKELEDKGIRECDNCIHKDDCQFFDADCYCAYVF